MINLRREGIVNPRYEPVIIDMYPMRGPDGGYINSVHDTVHQWNAVMKQQGYKVYATSVLSENHHQVAYLSNERWKEAEENFLRSDRNSLGCHPDDLLGGVRN